MSFSSKECVLKPSQLTRQSQDEPLSTAKARSIAIRTRISMKLAQMYPFFQVRLYAKVIKPPMLWLFKGLVIDSSSNRFDRERLRRDKIDEVRKTDAFLLGQSPTSPLANLGLRPICRGKVAWYWGRLFCHCHSPFCSGDRPFKHPTISSFH